MPAQISDSTKDVLNKLKGVMGDPTTHKIKTKEEAKKSDDEVIEHKPTLNTDDGKKLKLHNEAPDNLNDEIIANSKNTEDLSESLETQTPPAIPEFDHQHDSLKSAAFIDDYDNQESISINSEEDDFIADGNPNKNFLERNWQTAVQDELKDIIQFNEKYSDAVDLDQGFGIDKINNVKAVMNLDHNKKIIAANNKDLKKTEIVEQEVIKATEVIEDNDDTSDILEVTPQIAQSEPDDNITEVQSVETVVPKEINHLIEEPQLTPKTEDQIVDNIEFNDEDEDIADHDDILSFVDDEESDDIFEPETNLEIPDFLNKPIDYDITKSEKESKPNNNLDVTKESDFDIYDFEKAASKFDEDLANFGIDEKSIDSLKNIKNIKVSDELVGNMQNTTNKIMSDKTYNRAKSIIDSFRNQVNNNNQSNYKPQTSIQSSNNNSLEELVANAIKPMLKEWLDNNLSDIVEEVVAKEVKKLTDSK